MFHIWWDVHVQKFSQSPVKKEIMIFSCCQSPFFENCDVDQVPNILIIVMFVRKYESHEDLPLLTCLSFIFYPRNDWKENKWYKYYIKKKLTCRDLLVSSHTHTCIKKRPWSFTASWTFVDVFEICPVVMKKRSNYIQTDRQTDR